MELSIIIPCFNEENTIKDIINAIQNSGIDKYEIIIIDIHYSNGFVPYETVMLIIKKYFFQY